MRFKSICSEAWRNLSSGTSRTLLMFLAVFMIGGLLGGYEALTVGGLEATAAARINAQADTKTVLGAPVDGRQCDRISSVDKGPQASGAIRKGPQLTPLSTPGKDLASFEVTPSILDLILTGPKNRAAPSDPSGVWVPTDLAKDFGLSAGSRFETDHGTIRVAGIFDWPNDGRDTRFQYAVITPVSSGDGVFNECWAKQWPASPQGDSLLYSTTLVSSGKSQSGIMPLNKGYDSHYDAVASYRGRLTVWLPLVGLAVGLLLGIISVHRRRLEYAGALHSGQDKGAQLLGMGLETACWSGFGLICTGGVLLAVTRIVALADPWLVLWTAMRTPLALFAGCLIGALASGCLIRESRLFALFKDR